jgi:hypothetical protein
MRVRSRRRGRVQARSRGLETDIARVALWPGRSLRGVDRRRNDCVGWVSTRRRPRIQRRRYVQPREPPMERVGGRAERRTIPAHHVVDRYRDDRLGRPAHEWEFTLGRGRLSSRRPGVRLRRWSRLSRDDFSALREGLRLRSLRISQRLRLLRPCLGFKVPIAR